MSALGTWWHLFECVVDCGALWEVRTTARATLREPDPRDASVRGQALAEFPTFAMSCPVCGRETPAHERVRCADARRRPTSASATPIRWHSNSVGTYLWLDVAGNAFTLNVRRRDDGRFEWWFLNVHDIEDTVDEAKAAGVRAARSLLRMASRQLGVGSEGTGETPT
jgi:hypothetical protein